MSVDRPEAEEHTLRAVCQHEDVDRYTCASKAERPWNDALGIRQSPVEQHSRRQQVRRVCSSCVQRKKISRATDEPRDMRTKSMEINAVMPMEYKGSFVRGSTLST